MPAQTPNLHIPYPVPDDSVDVPRDMQAMANAIDPVAGGTVPAGSVVMFPGTVAPTGWALMKAGTTVPAAANPVLAGIYGQTGGNVTIPDMTDYFPTGAGTVPLGQTAGANSVALATAQIPAHSHGVNIATDVASLDHAHALSTDPGHTHPAPSPATFLLNSGQVFSSMQQVGPNMINLYYWGTTDPGGVHNHGGATWGMNQNATHAHTVSGSTQSAGSGSAHENRPLCRAMNFIIKLG